MKTNNIFNDLPKLKLYKNGNYHLADNIDFGKLNDNNRDDRIKKICVSNYYHGIFSFNEYNLFVKNLRLLAKKSNPSVYSIYELYSKEIEELILLSFFRKDECLRVIKEYMEMNPNGIANCDNTNVAAILLIFRKLINSYQNLIYNTVNYLFPDLKLEHTTLEDLQKLEDIKCLLSSEEHTIYHQALDNYFEKNILNNFSYPVFYNITTFLHEQLYSDTITFLNHYIKRMEKAISYQEENQPNILKRSLFQQKF